MTRVGVVDCGTNATRLLVADVADVADVRARPDAGTAEAPGAGGSVVVERDRRLVMTRMGQGVDATGRIGDAALQRVRRALDGYAAACTEMRVEAVGALATSAARDAVNGDALVGLVEGAFGVAPRILTGHEEAAATWRGAVTGLDASHGPNANRATDAGHANEAGHADEAVVVDIGGGSTELAMANMADMADMADTADMADRGVAGAPRAGETSPTPRTVSLALGSVRLLERVLHDDPPTAAQIGRARAAIRDALALAWDALPLPRATVLVAVAGTPLTLGALEWGLDDADDPSLHGATLDAAALRRLTGELLAMGSQDIAGLAPVVRGRHDVLPAGALILSTLADALGLGTVVLSRQDLLDDLARQVAAGRVQATPPWWSERGS